MMLNFWAIQQVLKSQACQMLTSHCFDRDTGRDPELTLWRYSWFFLTAVDLTPRGSLLSALWAFHHYKLSQQAEAGCFQMHPNQHIIFALVSREYGSSTWQVSMPWWDRVQESNVFTSDWGPVWVNILLQLSVPLCLTFHQNKDNEEEGSKG